MGLITDNITGVSLVTSRLSLNLARLLLSMLVLALVSSLKARPPKHLLDFRSEKVSFLYHMFSSCVLGRIIPRKDWMLNSRIWIKSPDTFCELIDTNDR